jgi:hypothetical protein
MFIKTEDLIPTELERRCKGSTNLNSEFCIEPNKILNTLMAQNQKRAY